MLQRPSHWAVICRGIRDTVTSETRQGSGHDWDDAKKAALFADVVSLKLSIDEAAALHGLRVDVIQEWLRQFRRSALVAFDERLKKTLIDQGANADALTAAEFTGHVEDVSIADLVQTIEIAGKDAVITVTHEGTDSRMWCSAGAIIDAESGRLSGEPAVYRILSFERGRMVADLRPEQRARTIYAATHRLLLESIRRKDESEKLERKLGNVNRLYRLGERSTSSRVRVSTDELSVLRLFDGPRRLRDVLAQSHIGDLESLTALVRLVDDGYLVETDIAPLSSRVPTEPRSVRSGPRSVRTERLEDAERIEAMRGPPPSIRAEAPGPIDTLLDGDAIAPDSSQRTPTSRHSSERDAREREAERRRADTVQRFDGGDATGSATSFVPIAVSRHPERTTMPRWVFAVMAAAVLAPAAFWFGETMSNLRAARRAHAVQPSATEQTEKAALEVLPSFSLSTRVAPDSAEIWLDRHPVASGHLSIVLPKDGTTHELRVAADGYIPVTLMFADVPPPREIRLEALPAVTQPAAAEPAAVEAGAAAAPPSALPAPPRAAPKPHAVARHVSAPASRRRAEDEWNALAADTAPPPPIRLAPPPPIRLAPPPPREEPRVQIIDDPAPSVRVIE
jgi:hypothetical protein